MFQYTATDLKDTIVAIATPPGVGALGIVRLSGPEAINICDAFFYGKDLQKQNSHTLHFGTIRSNQKIIDEVLVSVFKAPKSYTADNMIEVSCHGSTYILQQVVRCFIEKGARLAKPGEFTMRAFLNGRMDLSQAEAVADLIASETDAAHNLAIQQMRGGFSEQIQTLRQKLIEFASLIELELDFSEEDVEFANRADLMALINQIQILIQQLLQSFKLGNALKNGVATVIAGRPNAGKSTLLNALLKDERAIVSEIPGTTRDTIEETINIDGIPFRLIDTAGIRAATDAIEAIGVERTMSELKRSAITVFLFDVEEMTVEEVQKDIEQLGLKDTKEDKDMRDIPLVLVGNQIDKSTKTIEEYKKLFANLGEVLFVSSKEQTNLHLINKTLKNIVMEDKIQSNNTVVSNLRHYEALQEANQSLNAILQGIENQLSGELIAFDIRHALHHLGQITGEVTTDDLLASIFSSFCIGK